MVGPCCGAGLARLFGPRRKKRRLTTTEIKKSSLINSAGRNRPEDHYSLLLDTVGEGGFGIIRAVTSKTTGHRSVLKTVAKAYMEDERRFVKEIELQASLDHPNILKIHEIFEDDEAIHLVLSECKGGEVLDAMENIEYFEERDAYLIMKQVLSAMCYMHSKHIAHRDLTLDNLMFKYEDVAVEDNIVKLIDFGFAGEFVAGENSFATICGTPTYMAPEVASGNYSEKCDCWGCGIIMYFLLCGTPPFDGDTPIEILRAVKYERMSFDDPVWSCLKPAAKHLITKLCHRNPEVRFSMPQALTSPWIMDPKFEPGPLQRQCSATVRNLRRYCKKNVFERLTLKLIAQKIDDAHVRALQGAFTALDINGDGELSWDEIRGSFSKAAKSSVEDIQDLWGGSCDTIAYSDFLAANLNVEDHLKDAACWEAFRLLDADGDGQISIQDLQEVLASNDMSPSSEEIEEVYAEADHDGDQSISFDEMKQMLAR